MILLLILAASSKRPGCISRVSGDERRTLYQLGDWVMGPKRSCWEAGDKHEHQELRPLSWWRLMILRWLPQSSVLTLLEFVSRDTSATQ